MKEFNNYTGDVFYTTADIARLLNISLPTARQLFHSKGFPSMKIGRAFRVSRSAFERWAHEREVIR